MLSVVPLRYGIAFKKAFSDPVAFSALVKAALDIDFTPTQIVPEFSYRPPVAHVNISYDLFAEDVEHRTIVELQHVRDDESYDRFLYYHCIGLVEQIVSSTNYRFPRDVFTLVLMTRWPSEERLQFGRAVCDIDPVTEEGRKLGVYRHRLVFINARAPQQMLPSSLRPLMALVEDTLDGEVDEAKYPDEVSRRILAKLHRVGLTPEENATLKDEATWEQAKRESHEAGREAGLREAREALEQQAREAREAQEREARQAVADLCEVLGVELTEARQADLSGRDLAGLAALRAHLKAHRAWPLPCATQAKGWRRVRTVATVGRERRVVGWATAASRPRPWAPWAIRYRASEPAGCRVAAAASPAAQGPWRLPQRQRSRVSIH